VPIVTVIGLGIARDYPTIQAVILLFSLVYVLINLAVDLLYTLFDPRIRY
jgi:peptide/nickel transport system permease protein